VDLLLADLLVVDLQLDLLLVDLPWRSGSHQPTSMTSLTIGKMSTVEAPNRQLISRPQTTRGSRRQLLQQPLALTIPRLRSAPLARRRVVGQTRSIDTPRTSTRRP
jgi:hypothetical protein